MPIKIYLHIYIASEVKYIITDLILKCICSRRKNYLSPEELRQPVTKPASSPREKVDNTPLQTGKQISYHGWIRSMSRYHGVDLKYKNK